MLRIQSCFTMLFLGATVAMANMNVLGQRSVVTARAVLPPRALLARQNDFTCAQSTDSVCADGSGCCPQGAACFQSDGVGLCSVTCQAAQPTCVFNGVTACCPVGDSCGGSLCIPGGMNTGLPSPTSTMAATTTDSSDTTTTGTTTQTMTATLTLLRSASTDSCTSLASCTSTVTLYLSSVLSSTSALSTSALSTSTPPPVLFAPLENTPSSPLLSPHSVSRSTVLINGTLTQSTTTVRTATMSNLNHTGTATYTYTPLQVSTAAAPEHIKTWGLINVLGLAALGLVL